MTEHLSPQPPSLSLRRIFGLSGVYGITPIIDRAMSLLLLPIFTRYLDTSGYGSMMLLYTAASLLGLVAFMGLPDSLQKMYWDHGEKERKDFFGTIWVANAAIAAIVLVPLMMLAGPVSSSLLRNDKVSFLFILNCVRILITTQSIIPFVIFRAREQKGKILAVNIISIVVRAGLTAWLLMVVKLGLLGVFLADIGAAAATLVIYLPGLWREINLTFHWKYLGEAMTLFPFQFTVEVLAWIISLSDRILIQHLLKDTSQVGIYALGYTIGSSVLFLVSPFMAAWRPYVYSVHSASGEEYRKQMGQFFGYFYMICCCSFLVIASFSRELIILMTTSNFLAAVKIVPIVLLAQILATISNYFLPTFFIAKRMQLVIISYAVAAAANIGCNFLLIPIKGIMGSAWSTLISYAILAIMLGHFSQKKIPFKIPSMFLASVTIGTLGLWAILEIIPTTGFITSILIKGAIISTALLMAALWIYRKRTSSKAAIS